jgi:heme a synthase
MSGHDRFRYVAAGAFLLCYVTILLGGNVMASDAGLACPDWPTCHGTLWPVLSGPTGVEYAHRIAGFFLSVVVLGLAILGWAYEATRPVLRRMAVGALALVVGQALLGGLVVESGLGIGLVLVHLTLATFLFGLLLLLALLANLREIPPHWIAWAHRVAEERPPSVPRPWAGNGSATPGPAPTPSEPTA